MATLWIGQDYLIRHSVIDDNTEYDKITPVIELVQDKYILPLLGTSLYNTIETHILAYINSATTIPAAYKTIIDNYILKMMVHYIMYESSPTFKFRYANKGIMTNSSDNGQPIPTNDMEYLMNIWKTNGDGSFVRQGNDLNQLYNYGIGDTLLDIRNGRVLITLESVKEGVCPIVKEDIQLIIEPFPQFNFIGNPLIQCEPGEVDFTSIVRKPLSNIKYEWVFGNNSTSTIANPIDIKYDTANRNWYDVTLIVTNDSINLILSL
jgi:hypothetical protein